MPIQHLSLITTPVELEKDGEAVSFGTAFYYVSEWGSNKQLFLVTNYHVVTGNSPTERDLPPMGTHLHFYYHLKEDDPSYVVGIRVPLYTPDGEKNWMEHSDKNVDIAVIPLPYTLPVQGPIWGIGKEWFNDEVAIQPVDTVTLVGYPRMFFDRKNSLPIYKTGSVASEYDFDFEGQPCFIIDISAFAGNSGSPVFLINRGIHLTKNDSFVIGENAPKFLGVFASGYTIKDSVPIRIISNEGGLGVDIETDLQLGVVWRGELIQEIIENNPFDEYKEIVEKIIASGGFKFKIQNGFQDF